MAAFSVEQTARAKTLSRELLKPKHCRHPSVVEPQRRQDKEAAGSKKQGLQGLWAGVRTLSFIPSVIRSHWKAEACY